MTNFSEYALICRHPRDAKKKVSVTGAGRLREVLTRACPNTNKHWKCQKKKTSNNNHNNCLIEFGYICCCSDNVVSGISMWYFFLACGGILRCPPQERERQLTTARANQTTGLSNGRAANLAPKVVFSSFRALSCRQLTFPSCC